MTNINARINLKTATLAQRSAVTENGTPLIISDSGAYPFAFEYRAAGSWIILQQWNQILDSISDTAATAYGIGLLEKTATDVLTYLGISSTANVLPKGDGAGGMADSCFSDDGTTAAISRPLTLNNSTRAAWDADRNATQLDSLGAIWSSASGLRLARGMYYKGEFKAISPAEYASFISLGSDGGFEFASSDALVAADAVASVNARFRASRIGAPGFYGVTPPTSRPTISGQRTATATLAALYQALGLTGLILDATTGTSVTREAIIQPLPITNAAPGTVTVVSGGMKSFGFDGNASTEELFYHCDVQHDYIAGGDMVFHVHWMPATATGGNVKWQIEYQWVEVDATWPAPTTLAGTTAAGTTAWADKRTDFTIPGASHTYNSRLMVRLFRNPVDAADTYAGDAVLSSVGMHYQADPGQP